MYRLKFREWVERVGRESGRYISRVGRASRLLSLARGTSTSVYPLATRMGLEWAMQSRSYALASIFLLVALGYGMTDERGRQANARFWRRVDELGRGGDPGCALALFGVGYGGHEICNP